MSSSSPLTKKRISNGVYEGVYKSKKGETATPELELNYLGESIGETYADQIDVSENTWLIRCKIPSEVISDGVQTFLVCKVGDQSSLDSFSIASGEPLEDDLRNEISLLRQELDMLKRAFRRHCVETLG
jgi:hypothetical protein